MLVFDPFKDGFMLVYKDNRRIAHITLNDNGKYDVSIGGFVRLDVEEVDQLVRKLRDLNEQ